MTRCKKIEFRLSGSNTIFSWQSYYNYQKKIMIRQDHRTATRYSKRTPRHRLTKSSEIEALFAGQVRSRNATASGPFRGDVPSFKTHTHSRSTLIPHQKQNKPSRQDILLDHLYSNLVKYKKAHTNTLTTAKQKQRYLRRFAQTISKDKFKATGFQLDHNCLSYVFDFIRETGVVNKIVLDENSLGFEGIQKLADLVRNINMEELSLVSVGMNNRGAIKLFEALKAKATLKKLNISSKEGTIKNKITSEGIQGLRDILRSQNCNLQTLKMDNISLGNEGLKVAFEQIGNSSLQILSLSKNQLTWKYLSQFSQNIGIYPLVKLDLSKNNLSNQGIKIITDLIGVNYGKSRTSMNLRFLNLSDNHITSLGFEYFCREMCSNKTLESLVLSDNPLGDGQHFFHVKYFLCKNWRLKSLNLSNINCPERDIRSLCEGMEGNKSLEELSLSHNEITSTSLYQLFSMLTRNKFLKKLNLSTCKMCDNHLQSNEYIINNSTFARIEEIDLDNNYIGDKGAQYIKNIVEKNENIVKIELTKNCIGEKALISISNILVENQRKRPFQREINHLSQELQMYEDKSKNLNYEVQKMTEKEQYLQIRNIMDEIRVKDKEEDKISHEIKIQKRSIAKLCKFHSRTIHKKAKTNDSLRHLTEPVSITAL